MTHGRSLHTATTLAANGETGTDSLASAELETGTFSPTGSMADTRTFQAATVLADGRVLVTGGSADGWSYAGNDLASAEVCDAKTGSFATTGAMIDGLVAQTATLLTDGRVLIAGGHDRLTDVATAGRYDPASGTFAATETGD